MFSVMPWTKPVGVGREVFPTAYPINRLNAELAPIFNRLFASWPIPYEGLTYPETYRSIGLEETDKEYLILVEAPGFEVNNFDIFVVGNVLTVKAERKEKEGNGEKKEHHVCFGERCFEKSVTLPVGAEPEKISAIYKNGILEVHVPKCAEVKPRRIPVKS